jgi:hypothetical protein
MFELVETTRNYDEDLNYAVIRLIVSPLPAMACQQLIDVTYTVDR